MMKKQLEKYIMVGSLLLIFSMVFASCSEKEEINKDEVPDEIPILKKFVISANSNSENLIEDVIGQIVGDSIIECWIPYLTASKQFRIDIDALGGAVLDGMDYNETIAYDFSKPVELRIENQRVVKIYKVYVFSFTGLPVAWIETEGRMDVVSKDEYLNAFFRLEEGVMTRSAGEVIVDSVKIKGRGSSSWSVSPKKSYRLKFDNKVSLLHEPKDKSWVLIANYFDKTMLRNQTAYYMGKLSNLDYTPNFHFVELFFNGRYEGTYMLGDKLKIGENRVNVGDDGFLLEVDQRAEMEGDVCFRTKRLAQPINIKDPDVVDGDDNYTYISDYINKLEDVLFSENFRDENEGWRNYMDLTSFLDWYIIHEITKCGDPLCFYTSCYMNLKRDGKLKMGPIWDFDLTMGNSSNPDIWPVEGFVRRMGSPWFERLFEDPFFVKAVKERYAYFYDKKSEIIEFINSNARYLRYSAVENNNRWNVLYEPHFASHDIVGNYYNEVQYLKTWLDQRFEWLKKEFE